MRGIICTLFTLAACSGGARYSPIDTDGAQLRDASGRALLLRGVNAHVAGIFDVTFSDGRAPREPLPAFDAGDVAEMQQLGFNFLRLPISWSALEPAPGQFDTSYLDRVAAIVDLCRGHGVYVLIDLHEDGWSKEICEDGAPLWAIDPAPPAIPGGPVPGPDCHTAGAALAAFQSFFADDQMLQESYANMAATLAARFAGDQQVLGYEIMNEPLGEDDAIAAFNEKIARALRAADPAHLVVFEPSATRNFTNSSPIPPAPFPVGGAVYAVHIYTSVFGSNPTLAAGTFPPLLAGSIAGARDEAAGWGAPLMITEYGIGPTAPNSYQWIGDALDGADAALASTAYWLWKDPTPAPDTWGMFQANPDGSFTARPAMIAALSRPYPQAIGGDPISVAWDGAALTVEFRPRDGVPALHEIFWNRAPPTITCDGAAIPATSIDTANSLYTIPCAGHTLALH